MANSTFKMKSQPTKNYKMNLILFAMEPTIAKILFDDEWKSNQNAKLEPLINSVNKCVSVKTVERFDNFQMNLLYDFWRMDSESINYSKTLSGRYDTKSSLRYVHHNCLFTSVIYRLKIMHTKIKVTSIRRNWQSTCRRIPISLLQCTVSSIFRLKIQGGLWDKY